MAPTGTDGGNVLLKKFHPFRFREVPEPTASLYQMGQRLDGCSVTAVVRMARQVRAPFGRMYSSHHEELGLQAGDRMLCFQ